MSSSVVLYLTALGFLALACLCDWFFRHPSASRMGEVLPQWRILRQRGIRQAADTLIFGSYIALLVDIALRSTSVSAQANAVRGITPGAMEAVALTVGGLVLYCGYALIQARVDVDVTGHLAQAKAKEPRPSKDELSISELEKSLLYHQAVECGWVTTPAAGFQVPIAGQAVDAADIARRISEVRELLFRANKTFFTKSQATMFEKVVTREAFVFTILVWVLVGAYIVFR